ncbi:hypothetical protein KAFR_0D03980 [Kazachstania africana CBS 2517]|uniref:Glyoxylate reductase n=1 Tax=Kazachstania africana (strain ATCC 22294 / BCRC 22015 / CBS 2517 / CECT 1963 / NBRC 1671 / NRRL Y-8276) TaxID=1071382 RepID=H2AUJ6_KAZAF|nr:hypothetical protein KAFR_0D03980 [Kazachstania africana CBS 2517]CCF58046.1 hypothetical protein KAFR_0D03980 [Kazachstania africana CBS 2517]
MSKPIVLRLGKITYAQKEWEEAKKVVEVLTVPESTTRNEFIRRLKDPNDKLSKISAIARTYESIAQTGRFDKEIAESLPNSCVAVCHTGAGYDQIDVQYFNERHIQVSHTPGFVDNATATTHVFLLLAAMRNFVWGARNLRAGKWTDGNGGQKAGADVDFGHDLEGKTIGIVGLGGIGRALLKKLKPFDFSRILYSNRRRLSANLENGAEFVDFETLLKESDIISISVPLNSETRHLFNKETFAKMKDGVVIVNTARGPVINESDLIDALKTCKVRAAGLDVFEFEPIVPQELLDMPQVVTIPHMGTYSVETRKSLEVHVIDNVVSAVTANKVVSCVPEIKNEKWFLEL